jgi:hypothetical protein
MAITTSGIKGYIDDKVNETMLKLYATPTAMNYVTKAVGVKGDHKVNSLSVSAVFADGASCGAYGDSTGAFTATTVSNETIGTQIAFCEADLMDTYLSSTLTAGQLDQESSTVEGWLQDMLAKSSGEELGKLFWGGDKAGAGNLSKADGFVKVLSTSGVAVATPIAWTVANAYDEAFRIYSAYTGKDSLIIFVGTQKYKAFVASIGTKFAANPAFSPSAVSGAYTDSVRQEMVLPLAVDCKVVLDKGLDVLNADLTKTPVYAFAQSNVVVCEDLATDTSTVKVFRDEKDELLYLRLKFLFGIGIFNKAEVVKYVPV